jgi:hypothetical protein
MADGDNLVIGENNQTESTTQLVAVLTSTADPAFKVSGSVTGGTAIHGIGGPGVHGTGGDAGILGDSLSGAGVMGQSESGAGVKGQSESGHGVGGESKSGAGVVGQSDTAAGVFGNTSSSSVAGVAGHSDAIGGTSVVGFIQKGTGILGHAIADGIGVLAQGDKNAIGLVAAHKGEGGHAGAFFGNVIVLGSLTANVKNAVVPFPDGSFRLLTCMESPEAWFEDFGEGTLVKGRAEVKIDSDFAKVVDLSQEYHVFVTPHDSKIKGLAVVARLANHFVVEGRGGDGTFSFRLVAKRKGFAGQRFERVDVPQPPPDVQYDFSSAFGRGSTGRSS